LTTDSSSSSTSKDSTAAASSNKSLLGDLGLGAYIEGLIGGIPFGKTEGKSCAEGREKGKVKTETT